MRTVTIYDAANNNYLYSYEMLEISILEERQMIVFRNLKPVGNSENKECVVVLVFDKKVDMKTAISSLSSNINTIDNHTYLNVSSLVEEQVKDEDNHGQE